jgi:ubiquinone/menaquinone biosynthesis C-methylase UbiE
MARAWHRFIRPIIGNFRRRRGELVLQTYPELKSMNVLDVGGSVHFWFESGLIDHVGSVVIYNISSSEVDIASQASEKISFQLYDGLRLPEADQSFDLVLSNSVLEHIPHSGRAQIALEMMRVGKRGFVQTPALEFPIEPHFVLPFIHWLPRAVGRYLVRLSPWALLSRHSAKVQDAYFAEVSLLSKTYMFRLFPAKTIRAERFMGLPKAWLVTW